MATLAPKGTYVFLDDAALWLDYSSGRLHITSNDRDVPEGVHISIRPGTKTDAHLRRLLAKFDIPLTKDARDARDVGTTVDVPVPTIGFQRLPASSPDVEIEFRSKHHRRTSTWLISYPLADAGLVAQYFDHRKNWRGTEVRVDGDEMIAYMAYGPVLGAYDADLVAKFKDMDVALKIFGPLTSICANDCPHKDHEQD